MADNNNKLTRPAKHLIGIGKRFAKVNKVIDDFRGQRGKGLPNWDKACFLPMGGWYAIVCHSKGVSRLTMTDMVDLQLLASTHTWQYSKGVYRFDPDLYQALIASHIAGDLSAQVLHRLPEWCVYIETPDLVFDGGTVYGFFAHLEHDVNDGHYEIRLLLDSDKGMISVPLHLGDWSLQVAVDKYMFESARQAIKIGQELVMDINAASDIANDITPFVSLLLYLCSDEPDLTNRDEPNRLPTLVQPVKTKKGNKLFPADKVSIWSVGDSLGEQLRRTKSEYQQAYKGGHKKAHLRRGHYKTYWLGARDSDRKAVARWIAPAIVAGKQIDQD